MFADDTNLFCSGKDIKTLESMVNEELSRVEEWLMLNQLTLNAKKFYFKQNPQETAEKLICLLI